MKWSGKIVGGALGAVVGGPVGAALGALAGHVYDGKEAPPGGANAPPLDEPPQLDTLQAQQAVAERFFRTTFEVMGHLAKADGRVSETEIAAAREVMQGFQLDEPQRLAAIAHFNRGKHEDWQLTPALMALRRACVGRPDLLRVFVEIQVRFALTAHDLRGPVRPRVTKLAAVLGMDGIELAHLESVMRLRQGAAGARLATAQQLENAYRVLEVAPAVSDEELAKAYRRLLSRHHPDKLKANGLPESMLDHAKQRTQQIIEAYDLIRQARSR